MSGDKHTWGGCNFQCNLIVLFTLFFLFTTERLIKLLHYCLTAFYMRIIYTKKNMRGSIKKLVKRLQRYYYLRSCQFRENQL